jgi:hypothetical protein
MEVIVMGTLGFAVMGSILYVWGYRKSHKTPQRLEAQMGRVIEEKIKLCLTGQPHGATLKEIAKCIIGLSMGGQLQGYKLQVDDAPTAAYAVLRQMVNRGLVTEHNQGKLSTYVLTMTE